MSTVTVKFRDGTEKLFEDEGRPGGSYTNSVKYEGNFVIIKDAWDKRTAYPMDLVSQVETTERPRW